MTRWGPFRHYSGPDLSCGGIAMKPVIGIVLACVFAGCSTAPRNPFKDPCSAEASDPCGLCEQVERTVKVPAVTRCKVVPCYEEVFVPIYEQKCKPEYRDCWVDVWKTRDVPIYRTVRRPEYVDVEVPLYAKRRVPIQKEVCDPCTGEVSTVTCGWRQERYQCGTRTECRIGCWKKERIKCGTRCERYIADRELQKKFVGMKTENVKVGTRKIKRITGHKREEIEICPETTRTEWIRKPPR